LKSDGERSVRRAQFFAKNEKDAREIFYGWAQDKGMDLNDLLIMNIRDAGSDTISLDVKDAKIDTKGEV